MRVAWTSWLLVAASAIVLARAPSQKDVIERAGRYVLAYGDALPALVATETTEQHARAARIGGAVEVPFRRLVAEFAWVALPEAPEVIGFRDVVEVDGMPVTEHRARLEQLLHRGDGGTWAQVRAMLEEGARYNLAPGSRNFNLPTVVVFFLHPTQRARFAWSRTSADLSEWELSFKERGRPTMIRQGDGNPVFSRGRVRIDTATGAITYTELRLEFGAIRYLLRVRFAPNPALGLTLPAQLDEEFADPSGIVTGSATYTNYRRFQTGARLVQ